MAPRRTARRATARPRLEALEDRFAPAAVGRFVVTNNNATGAGSFDQAVSDLNNKGAGSNQIIFQGVTGTIALPHNEEIARNVDILGPGSSNLVLQGDFTFRLMRVNAGVTASITGLRLSGGEGGTLDGAAISNFGTLTLTNDLLDYNRAADGGAIWNTGSLTLSGTTLTDNTATELGGAIKNDNQLSLSNCMVMANHANAAAGIYNGDGATLSSSNSSITGNVSATDAGGVQNLGTFSMVGGLSNSGGTAVLTSVNVHDNSAANGGGFYCDDGSVSLNNSTLSGNSASGKGPGGAFKAPGTWSQSGSTINDAVVSM